MKNLHNNFPEEIYYHIYNRSVERKRIFHNKSDYYRFMAGIAFYQSHIGSYSLFFKRNHKRNFQLIKNHETPSQVIRYTRVRILNYCVMPNHYHLLIEATRNDGINEFIHDLQLSYSKYYNIKRNRVGPLWGGPYKKKPIEDERHYLTIVRYINENPYNSSMVNINDDNKYSYEYCWLNNPI